MRELSGGLEDLWRNSGGIVLMKNQGVTWRTERPFTGPVENLGRFMGRLLQD